MLYSLFMSQTDLLTGEISVRFFRAPSDAELNGFAAQHGLRLLRRNDLVPQQAVFRPVEPPPGDLRDVVSRIEGDAAARAVWANTLSSPQRHSRA
jgi:hypothetical protein